MLGLTRVHGIREARVSQVIVGSLRRRREVSWHVLFRRRTDGGGTTAYSIRPEWCPCYSSRPRDASPKWITFPRTNGAKSVVPLWAGTSLPFMEAGWDKCGTCSGLY